MKMAPGIQIDHYTVLAPLGAGGMGEVWRAHDARLDRAVAIKVLPADYTNDPERLKRFEQEARATSALNHANILTVHDFGTHAGVPYLVAELLEGEELRVQMNASPLPVRKALDYARQLAAGLAAAHEKGIIHRDLKPENVFVTHDGRVKILDFGLAKLKPPKPAAGVDAEAETMRPLTNPGVVMGTIGYMSPEQVRGQEVDARSDLFSCGVILYEMLSGQRAFGGVSLGEVMSAILKEEPPDLLEINGKVPPQLERIVRHCLEKQPAARFQSARDLGFDLESVSLASGATQAAAALEPVAAKRRSWPLLLGLALVIMGLGITVGILAGKPLWRGKPPTYRQKTFRLGTLTGASFAPDGQTIVYSAAWNGQPSQLYLTRLDSPESRPLGVQGKVLAISVNGEMAVLLPPMQGRRATLARVPLAGGAPREVLEDVKAADWSPDGRDLAIVRRIDGKDRLEYPIGTVLYETTDYIRSPRVSPKGDQIAFENHVVLEDGAGRVVLVDLQGEMKPLTHLQGNIRGIAWSAAGDEVWFTAADKGINQSLFATTLSGQVRVLATNSGSMIISDNSRAGSALIWNQIPRSELKYLAPGETNFQDLSWHEYSHLNDLSSDGKVLLFTEGGESIAATGTDFEIYLHRVDESAAVHLGSGMGTALSPDGKWVLSVPYGDPAQIVLLPTGPGDAYPLTNDKIRHLHSPAGAKWFSDGQHILFNGVAPGQRERCYVQAVKGDAARPLTPEGTIGWLTTPDGKFITTTDASQTVALYHVETGMQQALPGLLAGDRPIQWSLDGKSLYVAQLSQTLAKVYRYDRVTKQRMLWKELGPADHTGILEINGIRLTPDAKSIAVSYARTFARLFLVEGLQ